MIMNLSQQMMPASSSQRNLAIQAIGLQKSYGSGATAFLALEDVSIDIAANEFFTLLGPSGCGKTTLLRLTSRRCRPSNGRSIPSFRTMRCSPICRSPKTSALA
jgi:spermidine/putrescine transport system ATP-binding protein